MIAPQVSSIQHVDYSGMTISIHNRETGEKRPAQVFVGVLGGSSYTYCEATWTQRIRDWISSHVRMFEYFGGVSRILVPDNLKAAVTKAHRYEPEINPSYQAMCRYRLLRHRSASCSIKKTQR